MIYSTDNGAEVMFWPDGGMTPFRGEKASGWEGGFGVPCLVCWPGHIRPGQVSNGIVAHEDWLPTLLAAVGVPDVKERLLKGYQAGSTSYKVHLDGYNLLPYLTGQTPVSPRKEFFYFNDDGSLVGLRYDRWKLHFAEQRAHGLSVWQEPWMTLRIPKRFDLRGDPFERADYDSELYQQWREDRAVALVPAQAFVARFLQTFQEFPPRQRWGASTSTTSVVRATPAGRPRRDLCAARSCERVRQPP